MKAVHLKKKDNIFIYIIKNKNKKSVKLTNEKKGEIYYEIAFYFSFILFNFQFSHYRNFI